MSKRSHGEYVESPTGSTEYNESHTGSKKARVNVNTKSTETLEGALGNLSTAHSSLEKLVTEDLWKRDRPLDESTKLKEILEQAKTALVKSATFLNNEDCDIRFLHGGVTCFNLRYTIDILELYTATTLPLHVQFTLSQHEKYGFINKDNQILILKSILALFTGLLEKYKSFFRTEGV